MKIHTDESICLVCIKLSLYCQIECKKDTTVLLVVKVDEALLERVKKNQDKIVRNSIETVLTCSETFPMQE